MKNLLVIAFVLISIISNAQLKSDALVLKNSEDKEIVELYKSVRLFAVDKWGSDNEMIVYVINNQCSALLDFVNLELPETIKNEYVVKWSKEINGVLVTDWQMVLYNSNNWLKNSNY